MKDDDFVAARGEGGQFDFKPFDGSEEIGDQYNKAAFANDFNDTFERRCEISRAANGRLFQGEHEMPQVAGAVARRQIFANLFVECQQPHGIALQIKEIGEGGCQSRGVFRFGVAQ